MIDWRAASALRQAFKRHLPFTYHRLNALARAVLAVCQWRTVNLASLAAVLNPRVKTSSNDTRLQRLIHELPFDKTDQAAIAVPLFWKALDKTGNSNTQERKHLLQRVLDTFGAGHIHHLLADREFLGQDGLAWLAHQHIPFIIRLKRNLQVDTPQGPVAVRTLFDDLERGKTRTLRQPRRLLGQDLFLSAKRLKDDTFVILAAPTPIPRALRQYAALSLFRYGLDHLQALLAGGGGSICRRSSTS